MPQPHPHDVVMVKNIWEDAPKDYVITETTQQTIKNQAASANDPSGMNVPVLEFKEVTHSFRPAEAFEVKWNGRVYRLRPGESRAMPRYLAQHFAKKIADAYLGSQDPTGKLGYVNSATKRPETIAKILGDVLSYAGGDDDVLDPNQQAMQRADEFNRDGIDNGEFDPLLGNLQPEPTQPDPNQQPPDTEDPDKQNDPFANKTKSDLLKEAQQLNLEVTGREKKEDLIELIKKNFA